MIKVMVAITKLPSISSEQFQRYYEDHHVPLVNRLLPMYQVYKRHYLAADLRPGLAPPAFDVLTELGFASEADFVEWQNTLRNPAVQAEIRQDEAHFLISAETRMWVVTECASDFSQRPA